MRDCVKNKQQVYFSKFIDKEEILKDGKRTGTFSYRYGIPKKLNVNIRSSGVKTNNLTYEQFGVFEKHSLIIYTSRDYNIDILDKFWVDIRVVENANYIVGGVYKTLNTIFIGLDKVI